MPGRVAEVDTPRRLTFRRMPGAMRMLRRKRKGIVRDAAASSAAR